MEHNKCFLNLDLKNVTLAITVLYLSSNDTNYYFPICDGDNNPIHKHNVYVIISRQHDGITSLNLVITHRPDAVNYLTLDLAFNSIQDISPQAFLCKATPWIL